MDADHLVRPVLLFPRAFLDLVRLRHQFRRQHQIRPRRRQRVEQLEGSHAEQRPNVGRLDRAVGHVFVINGQQQAVQLPDLLPQSNLRRT